MDVGDSILGGGERGGEGRGGAKGGEEDHHFMSSWFGLDRGLSLEGGEDKGGVIISLVSE